MTNTTTLDLAWLRQVARQHDPEARFVSVRGLRRVIRRLRDLDEFGSRAPHDLCLHVTLSQLRQCLTPSELGIEHDDEASVMLLIPAPDPDARPADELRRLWRVLFHAAIDRRFDEILANGTLGRDQIEHFILRWGPAQWAEIRLVLAEDHRIGNDDHATIFREFLAHYLEIQQFEPFALHALYPGLRDPDTQLAWVLQYFDAATLAANLRPREIGADTSSTATRSPEPILGGTAAPAWRAKAQHASENGNDVRAVVLLVQAHDAQFALYIGRLAERLANAFGFKNQTTEWLTALRPLSLHAGDGIWSIERRGLYQLQKACLDLERDLYAIDLSEWALTLGKQKIKRQLTKPRWLYAVRHLRAAVRQIDASRLTAQERAHLHDLLEHAIANADLRARAELRPEIVAVFDEIGLIPANTAERVSRTKAIEELLDTAVVKGIIRIGDLRDAIARSRIKLPDLRGPGEFLLGDPLLRANRALAVRLDGVYRRGEIYMRWLQRGCSLFFGTKPGRVITKYVALPLGGAYVAIEAFNHAVEAVEGAVSALSGWSATLKGLGAFAGGPAVHVAKYPDGVAHGIHPVALGLVAGFIFLMLHWSVFRCRVVHWLQLVCFKLPKALIRSPLCKWLFNNPATRFFKRHLLIPVSTGTVAMLLVHFGGEDWTTASYCGAAVAFVFMLLAYTAFGRGIEDRMSEAAERAWRMLSVNFVLGLFTWVLHFFQSVLGFIDRGFYAVDEWLRFRSGESRWAFVFKLFFGTFWFVLTYIFRFAWNLLVEPQINPIKHFPVVTVSHKMLLPLIPSLSTQFAVPTETMTTIVFGIPGIFGFIVWEFKENWKLYRANAPETLRPLIIGSHGEKMRALLRPGFHSGVVPKTFAKWRKALSAKQPRRAAKHQHHLEHIAESIHHFIERVLLNLLREHPVWANISLKVPHIELAVNRVRVPLHWTADNSVCLLSFEERGGWVIASIEDPGWLSTLDDVQRVVFRHALLGLYQFAGVHAVREQIAAELGSDAYRFDAVPEGLFIQHKGTVQFFDYDDGPELLAPKMTLPTAATVLSAAPVDWVAWSQAFDATPMPILLPDWNFLPPNATT